MWTIIGLLVGAGLVWLVLRLRDRNIAVKWYEWLIGAVGLLLLTVTIQNFTGSFAEHQPSSAWMYLLMMGVPAIILLVVDWQLIARRQRAG